MKHHVNYVKCWKWYNIDRKRVHSKVLFKIEYGKSAHKMDFLNHGKLYMGSNLIKSRLRRKGYYDMRC